MIEIKELRVGNWVIKDGENYKITNVNDYIASIVNPIALDEKLYQDIISDSNNLIFLDGNSNIYDKITIEHLSRSIILRLSYLNFEIKYLHQLQNIFFDLTSVELSVDSYIK